MVDQVVVPLGLSLGILSSEIAWRAIRRTAGVIRPSTPPPGLFVACAAIAGGVVVLLTTSKHSAFRNVDQGIWDMSVVSYAAGHLWLLLKVFQAVTERKIKHSLAVLARALSLFLGVAAVATALLLAAYGFDLAVLPVLLLNLASLWILHRRHTAEGE
jgi:hypothetical protein